jgi:hypothetical protein
MVQRLRLFYLIILIFLVMYFFKSQKSEFQLKRLVRFYETHLTAFPAQITDFIVRDYSNRDDRVVLQITINLDKLPSHKDRHFKKVQIICNFDIAGNHLETSVSVFEYEAHLDSKGDVYPVKYDPIKKFFMNTKFLTYIPYSTFSWPGGFNSNPVEFLTYFCRNWWGYNE